MVTMVIFNNHHFAIDGKKVASNLQVIAITTFSPRPYFSVPLHQVPILERNTQTQNFYDN